MSLGIREVRLSAFALGEALQYGEAVSIGRHMYGVCDRCRRVVQLNKRLFGSLHLCREMPRPKESAMPAAKQEAQEPDPKTLRPPPPPWPEAKQKPPY